MKLELKLEPEIAAIRGLLQARMNLLARSVDATTFAELGDGTVRSLLRDGFAGVRGDEGSLWLLDPDRTSLTVAYNSGPNAQRMVGVVRQSVQKGLVSMAVASEQAFLESDVQRSRRHSEEVDAILGQQTLSMIVVPIYLLRECRGVLSCVQLRAMEGRPAFGAADLVAMQRLAAVFDDLIDYRLLARASGWSGE